MTDDDNLYTLRYDFEYKSTHNYKQPGLVKYIQKSVNRPMMATLSAIDGILF